MLIQYHKSITCKALNEHFNPRALEVIVAANLKQDNLRGQIGHDEYHFDNNAFKQSYAFIEKQRKLAITSLQENDASSAWAAFGRLTHTVQDFYAHTNYVDLWLACFEGQTPPPPSQIAPFIEELIHSPDLRSGKLYYPFEALSYVEWLKPLVIQLLPKDSHAWMNLDSPESGEKFEYAFEAAIKRTVWDFEKTTTYFSASQAALFQG